MQLQQVDSAVAIGRAHLHAVRAALAGAPPDSVGVVSADMFGATMVIHYAPSFRRFGSRMINGVHVFATSLATAQGMLRARDHQGERDILTRIARQLRAGRCVVFAAGAVVLIDAADAAEPAGASLS